jgi:hypothetical protein
MNDSHLAQAGTDGAPDGAASPDPLRFDGIETDPEIEALLEFEPVPRKVKRPDGWTGELQREFIARLALCGVPSRAADQMGKNISGIEAIYRQKGGESLRAAWDAALELWRRRAEEAGAGEHFEGRAPGLNLRGGARPSGGGGDEWDDEADEQRRAEEARDSIRGKLLRCRRLFLEEISGSPGKRAAFEILTELPVDWDKAAAGEPQPDEPWASANQREPDMVLTAESGWSFGELGYGPDKKAAAREAIDEHRAEQGLPAVDWSGGGE